MTTRPRRSRPGRSPNGTTFTSFGAPISVTQYLSQPGGLRVGVFAKHDAGGTDDVAQFDAFNVVVEHAIRRRRATTAAATGSARRPTSSTVPPSTRSGRS